MASKQSQLEGRPGYCTYYLNAMGVSPGLKVCLPIVGMHYHSHCLSIALCVQPDLKMDRHQVGDRKELPLLQKQQNV